MSHLPGHPGSISLSFSGSKKVHLSVSIASMVINSEAVGVLFRERMASAQTKGQAAVDHLKEVWERRRDTPHPAGSQHPHDAVVEAANTAVQEEAKAAVEFIKDAERRLMEAIVEPLVDLYAAKAAVGRLGNAASRFRPVV